MCDGSDTKPTSASKFKHSDYDRSNVAKFSSIPYALSQLRLRWAVSTARTQCLVFLTAFVIAHSVLNFLTDHARNRATPSRKHLESLYDQVLYTPSGGTSGKARPTSFDLIVQEMYDIAADPTPRASSPPVLDLDSWTKRSSGDQLLDPDRELLYKYYANANSVFEFGLGESTHLAAHALVPRYSGVDSDAHWLSVARDGSPSHFRFTFADIGKTRESGYAVDKTLKKNVYDYQVVPLANEREPFDVYFVDARWRVGCAVLSFLHASAFRKKTHGNFKGGSGSDGGNGGPFVIVHDYANPTFKHAVQHIKRRRYTLIERVADIVDTPEDGLLAVFRRKEGVTDEELWELWHEANLEPLIPILDGADI